MRWLIVICLLVLNINAQQLKPYDNIKVGGNVADMTVQADMLVVGTDAGTIESYNIQTKAQLFKVAFPKIKDFTGDEMSPKVFSVDYQNTTQKYLAVVQAQNGYRELYTVQNGTKKKLVDVKDKLFISKAKFIDENRVIIALLSNEYILFDISSKKQEYRVHVSFSHFSDFMLNEDKTLIAGSCESGEISIINVADGKVKKVLKGGNVDNVYKVDFKNDKVLAAGQDRRAVVYDLDTDSYSRHDGHFLIYAGALSESAKKAAFAFTEENDIVVFDLFSGNEICKLSGQKSTLNSIVFIDENTIVSGSDDKYVMLWKLK